jgi:hypothetical protein
MFEKWVAKRTYIDGQQLQFTGGGGGLLLRCLLWSIVGAALIGCTVAFVPGLIGLSLSDFTSIDFTGIFESVMEGNEPDLGDLNAVLAKVAMFVGILMGVVVLFSLWIWIVFKKWFVKNTHFANGPK